MFKAELDAQSPEHKSDLHEVDAGGDSKFPSEMAGHEIVELDPYGRKWPPSPQAVEIGGNEEIYELDAGEVAIEMSGVGNGRRRSRGGRPMSFVEGDDWSPEVLVSASSDGWRRRDGMGEVSPVSRMVSPASPASEGFSPRSATKSFM
jgi:hypothetical protein